MKLLISFIAMLLLIFATTVSATTTTVTTVTKTVKTVSGCPTHKYHKHHKKHHYKKSYRVRGYYVPGCCRADACACGGVVCYPGHYYQCRTEYYYRSGVNSARVEVCE